MGLRLRPPPTVAVIAIGGGLIAAYLLFPTGSTAQTVVYDVTGMLAAAAIALGIRRQHPLRALPWWLLFAGVLLWTAGDTIFNAYPEFLGRATPYPSLADPLYLAGYACLVAVVVSLLCRRARIRPGGLLDVLVLGAGVALLLWTVAIEPVTGSVNSLADVLSIAYPTLDAILFLAFAELALRGRNRSLQLLALGAALLFASDLLYGLASLGGTYVSGAWGDVGWLLSYVVWAASAWSPSLRTVAAGSSESARRARMRRMLMIALPSIAAPALPLVHAAQRTRELEFVVGVTVAMFLLVFVRVVLLTRETGAARAALHEAHLRREADELLNAQRLAHGLALRESEERFHTAFDEAPIGMMLTSLDDELVLVNHALEEMLGYDTHELVGRRLDTFTHPDDVAATRELCRSLLAGEVPKVALEKRYRRKDGSYVDVRTDIAAIRDAAGAATHLIRQVQDVSELKRAENELRESQRLHRLVLESAGEMITVLDLDGTVVLSSRATADLLGYAPEELQGSRLVELVHPDDVEAATASVKSAAHTGAPASLSARLRRKDGEWRLLQGTAAPAIREDGGRRYFVVSVRDVTDRNRLEEQLRQAQKVEAIGRLAGGMAHDFNNVLTAIVGYSDLTLLGMNGDTRLRRNVEEIRRAADRGGALTKQLLAFSRRQKLEPQTLSLNGIVDEYRGMLKTLLGEALEVATTLDPALGAVFADAAQLGQVLVNLSVNARDAMPAGGTLLIETANVALDALAAQQAGVEAGRYVALHVSDTGVGMTPEVREQIFDPFFTTKEPGKGTGLGLSTVLGILKQSGGGMTVYSEPGLGTTFKLYLPRVDEAPDRAEEQETALVPGRGRVLLVEDEAAVRATTRAFLELAGYEVLDAATPDEAIALVANRPVEMLITDVVMPQMNGHELARTLLAERPGLRVLYMSGYTAGLVTERGAIESDNAFLQKPFTGHGLTYKVKELLAG